MKEIKVYYLEEIKRKIKKLFKINKNKSIFLDSNMMEIFHRQVNLINFKNILEI